jgi:exopolysaccharide biosynthesis operon protein EpsL
MLLALSVSTTVFAAMSVRADEYDTLNFAVGGNVSHDSNVFRAADSANAQSDTISTGYVGLRFNKPYAQQRFQADITETAYRYQTSSQLNFNGLAYRAAWQWHLTPRFSGTLSADRSESLVSFADTNATNRNVRTTDNRIFNLDGEIAAPWHVLLGVKQSDQSSEVPTQAQPDFRSVAADAGLMYLTSSGNTVRITQRAVRGHYLNAAFDPNNFTNADYRQYESELQATWNLSAKSVLSGQVAWLDRRNDTFTQGDFSGLTGALSYVWTPVYKLSLEVAAKRDLVPWQDVNATYRVDNAISLAPTWRVSTRIAVRARVEHVQSAFRGGSANGSSREDVTNTALVGADWTPLRSLTLGASLQEDRRSSSDPLSEYHATVANISAALLF